MSDSYKVIQLGGQDERLAPYLNMILSNWLNTLRNTNEWYHLIDKNVYYEIYPKVIQMLLEKPTCQVSLAVLADDEDICLGWAVHEPETLHYCYVPRHARKKGIGASLIPKDIKQVTHLTLTGVLIWKQKYPNWIFNPLS